MDDASTTIASLIDKKCASLASKIDELSRLVSDLAYRIDSKTPSPRNCNRNGPQNHGGLQNHGVQQNTGDQQNHGGQQNASGQLNHGGHQNPRLPNLRVSAQQPTQQFNRVGRANQHPQPKNGERSRSNSRVRW